ncbi:class I SAM-dependent methyltransferase [Candidatus Pelagibacter bacterium]|nr:class I SAM-dependent methyltransferase [Candidatus Pelagibacter bacterium]
MILKKFKAYLKLLAPPILFSENFKKIYNRRFNKDKITHHFEYEKKFYSRIAFINKAISNYKDCKYLEIGVASKCTVFNSIPLRIEDKFGVDPDNGGNYKMTSDEFFRINNHLKFDVIFIDGLHEYEQCQRDCLNSIKQLNPGGIIFFHDLLPRSIFEEKIPRQQPAWSGNVWKVGVELANSLNAEFKIINIDHGLGVLKPKQNFLYQKIDNLKDENFSEFLEYKKKLPIITSEEGLEFVSN